MFYKVHTLKTRFSNTVFNSRICTVMSECCLTPSEQFAAVSYWE